MGWIDQGLRALMDKIAASPGTGAVVAALLAATVAIAVAVINAVAATRLARSSAHRTYREDIAQPFRRLAAGIGNSTAKFMTQLETGALSEEQKRELVDWLLAEYRTQESKMSSLYVADSQLVRALDSFTNIVEWATAELIRASDIGGAHAVDRMIALGFLIQGAASNVLVSCEAYVYGGPWLRVAAARKHLLVSGRWKQLKTLMAPRR